MYVGQLAVRWLAATISVSLVESPEVSAPQMHLQNIEEEPPSLRPVFQREPHWKKSLVILDYNSCMRVVPLGLVCEKV